MLVLLAAGTAAPAMARDVPPTAPTIRNGLRSPAGRAALERAAQGALRRLHDAECQKLFAEYRDAEGRALQERLAALGRTAGGYLATMWFADGSGTRACQSSENIFVTAVGSPAVFVCERQIRRFGFYDPAHLERLLIHEELHSLGLGENPPSSDEINGRVARRCGRQ